MLVALHGLGVVWGNVKPDNVVFRGDRLVAVDFGSTCVEVGSTAQLELGADADTSFTSSPSDQFAWSVQYAAPGRARNGRLGSRCVARRSQVRFAAKRAVEANGNNNCWAFSIVDYSQDSYIFAAKRIILT